MRFSLRCPAFPGGICLGEIAVIAVVQEKVVRQLHLKVLCRQL